MKTGIELIAAERERQIKKGWNAFHDDDHKNADLTLAAMAYAHEGAARQGNWLNFPRTHPKKNPPRQWPFDDYYWNPEEDAIGNLVKAGALIAAEIDRLQRKRTAAGTADEKPDGQAENAERTCADD